MARRSNPGRPDSWVVEYHNRHAGANKRQRLSKRRHRRRQYNRIGRQMVERLRQGGTLPRFLTP